MQQSKKPRRPVPRLAPSHPELAQVANAVAGEARAVGHGKYARVCRARAEKALDTLALSRPYNADVVLRWLADFDEALRLAAGRGRPANVRRDTLQSLAAADRAACDRILAGSDSFRERYGGAFVDAVVAGIPERYAERRPLRAGERAVGAAAQHVTIGE